MTRPTREHGTAPIVDVCDVCGEDGWDMGRNGPFVCATCEGTGHVCTHCRVWPCECEIVASERED